MSDASLQPTESNATTQEQQPPLLKLVNVTRRFGGLVAVDNLSLSLRPGEILGVIGPNGAGKSTMVNLVSGFATPNTGAILYQGLEISRLPANRRNHLGIARTFQLTQPFKGLDVRENVMIGAFFGRHKMTRQQALRKADAVLEQVNLTHKAHFKGDQLTVADRKRLEMARALATDPQLLLLDEVMAGLTPIEIEQAVELIREINRSGITVLVIEHVVRAIMSLSDRVLVLHHGRKIAEDTPAEVLSDPRVIEAYLGERYARQRKSKHINDENIDVGL